MVNVNFGKVMILTNMMQADLGQVALKVGETVLGSMAYGAARNRVGGGEGLISEGLGGRL